MEDLIGTALASIGLAAAVASHGVSRRSALLGIYPLEDRNTLEKVLALLAMWAALGGAIAWLWLNKTWWVALILTIAGALGSNVVLFALPRESSRGLPLGRAALICVSIAAVALVAGAYAAGESRA